MNKWWWLTWNQPTLSLYERRASIRLLLTGLCLFIAEIIPLNRWGPKGDLGVVSVLVAAVIAFGIARLICTWIWPEVIRQADEKAAARLAKRE